MSGQGHQRTLHDVRVASGLPPKADIRRQPFDVGFGPNADIPSGYKNLPHARSVAHQISLLPPTMTTPNAIHS
jgi:hypothetical protein